MVMELSSYPKIYNLGHAAIESLFLDDVLVEEKVDGSQFSFGVKNGVLQTRSKGAQVYRETTNKLFKAAVEYVHELFQDGLLVEGWTYRGEVLHAPRHNALVYDRVPKHNIIIFDVNTGEEKYLSYEEKKNLAAALDLEVVPIFYDGTVSNQEMLREFLERTSILGGQKVEGIVIKSYLRFGKDGKALMGKWVRAEFKEVQRGEWKKDNPTTFGVIEDLVRELKTPARWEKAVQHLRELGGLTNDPSDIGILMKEVQTDVYKEEADYIKQKLFDYAWKKIGRRITGGLPEWYKEKIMVNLKFKESSINGENVSKEAVNVTSTIGTTNTSD